MTKRPGYGKSRFPRVAHVLTHPLTTAYTDGMGWRVMQGRTIVATGFDTREEAQARMAELVG